MGAFLFGLLLVLYICCWHVFQRHGVNLGYVKLC